MSSFRHVIWVALVIFALSACGGGGSSGGDSGAQNPPPSTPTYSVITSVTGSGSGSISPTSRTVSQGSTTSFTISPASGSTVSSVSGCGGSLSGTTYTTGPVNSACTVTASFELASTPTPTVSAGGLWEGYARLGIDWDDFQGFVTESGRAYFTDDGGSWVASVQITNNGNVITGGQVSPANSIISILAGDPNFFNAPIGTPTLTGTVYSRTALDARALFSDDTLVIEVAYQQDEYEKSSSLASVAGTYKDWWELFEEEIVLTITNSGTLSARAPSAGCDVNGTISVINSSYNLYDIRYTYSGCSDPYFVPLNGVQFTGLAALMSHRDDDLDPYPYLEIISTATVNELAAGDYLILQRQSSASAGGVWRGSIQFGNEAALALDGVITADGQVRLRDSEGRQIFIGQSFDAFSVYQDDVRAQLSWSLPIVVTDGSVQGYVVMLATLTERTRLSGSLEFLGNEGDIELANFTLAYDPIYEKPSSLALLAGTYLNPGHTMVIDSAGSVLFTSTVTNCVHQGFAQRADRNNAYQLDLLASSCTGNYEFLNGTISTGLAFLTDGLVPADTLVFRSHATLSNGRYVVGNWDLQR